MHLQKVFRLLRSAHVHNQFKIYIAGYNSVCGARMIACLSDNFQAKRYSEISKGNNVTA